jgi:hypothetical protein
MLPFMAAHVVFVALGASIIVAVLRSRSAGAAAVVFGTIFGGFLFVCGIIGIISCGPDPIAPRPLIWITDEGFEQHVVHPHVFVLWSEPADVSLITRSNVKTVAVQVRNPDLLPRRRGAINGARKPLVGRCGEVLPWHDPGAGRRRHGSVEHPEGPVGCRQCPYSPAREL